MESAIVIAGLICVFIVGSVYARRERIRRAYRIVRKKLDKSQIQQILIIKRYPCTGTWSGRRPCILWMTLRGAIWI